MPAHSFLISLAQGLPACCARATEPESSSAVITSPDRFPAIFGFLSDIRTGPGLRVRHAMHKNRVLFDQLVGARQQRRRKSEAERCCGLLVDQEVEFRGLIDRDVAWPDAAQDLMHVAGHAPQELSKVHRI